ncbi:aryl-alcohol dehydrogenase-like predicted oxidoreductase [Parageobacillus caldoxylosilyticus]|nr:aryl-alcohol dehydrogenase-like predicted oxidoreductase [Parageobacillus caldoxylosilyticus]
MEYVKLGNTGLDVSRICLGCMALEYRVGDILGRYLMRSVVVKKIHISSE